MNVRRFVVLLIAGVLAGSIAALNAAAATLPPEVRTTTNGASVRPTIQKFIDNQVAKFSSDTPATQSQGRESIIAEVQAGGPTQPPLSPIFFDVYADVLNTALMPLANNPDPRIRLNVAITAARVAEASGNSRLMPLVVDLLNDQSEAVLIWAIKGSKFIIPQVLGNVVTQQNNPLLPAFTKTVSQHSDSGPIIQTAYESLRLDPSSNVPAAALNNVVPILVNTVQQLVQNRISQYRTGIPKLSPADAIGTSFLVDNLAWKAQSKAQQLQTMQVILDLLSVASQRWDAASPVDRQDLTEVINKASQSTQVVGQYYVIDPKLEQASISKVIPLSPAKDVVAHVDAIRAAAVALPDFASLKPSPSLEPLASTAPTSVPTEP